MALAILQKDRAFDLLFTDIRMPSEMDGWELAAEAKRLIPDLQVVFATGFNDSGGRLCEGDRMVSKPYRKEALLSLFSELGYPPDS